MPKKGPILRLHKMGKKKEEAIFDLFKCHEYFDNDIIALSTESSMIIEKKNH